MKLFRILAACAGAAVAFTAVAASAQTATTYGGVANASGVALGAPGEVFTSVSGSGNVVRVAPGGGSSTLYGTGSGGNSTDVLRDPAGNIYVAHEFGAGVTRYAAGCATPCAPTTFDGAGNPFMLAMDSGGNLYVSSYVNDRIDRYAAGCVTPCTPTTFATLVDAGGMVFDSAGNLYAIRDSGDVLRYAAGCVTPCTGTVYATGVGGGARGLALGQGGVMYATNATAREVYEIPSGGGAAALFGSYPGMSFPLDLQQDVDGQIYLADFANLYVLSAPIPPAPTIPTLSEWAMILMGLMLAGMAALRIRQRALA